jgi:hypothetical protein
MDLVDAMDRGSYRKRLRSALRRTSKLIRLFRI